MATKSQHAEFLELARNLGADHLHAIHVGASVVYLEPTLGSKGSLLGASLRIALSAPIAPYEILLRSERALDRAGKDLRINHEIQTGDPAFDRDVYIETDGQDVDVKRILGDPAVRDAIRAIVVEKIEGLALGGEPVAKGIDDPNASCIHVRFGTSFFTEVEALRRILASLASLARDMDRVAIGAAYRGGPMRPEPAAATKDRMGRGLVLLAWCVMANIMGWSDIGFGAPPTFGRTAFLLGCAGGAMAWALVIVLAAVLLRGRSTSLRNVLLFAVCSFATILVGGHIGERLNATLDHTSSYTVRATAILRPQKKHGPHHQVIVDATDMTVNVHGHFRSAVPFTYRALPIVATLGEGAFGSPYLVSLHPK